MIELTVGLPLFKGGKIAWLAIESLINQVSTDFEWELIVMEENIKPTFGAESLELYKSQLKDNNCVNIKYIIPDSRVKLNVKWVMLAQEASPTSKVFVFQAQDVYSFPLRLFMSHNMVASGKYHWVETREAVFYDILSNTFARYNNRGFKNGTGLNLAMDINIVKRFTTKPARMMTGLDSAMLYEALKNVKNFQRREIIYPPNYGLETNGISYAMSAIKRSEHIKNFQPPYHRIDIADVHTPDVILKRLYDLHEEISEV